MNTRYFTTRAFATLAALLGAALLAVAAIGATVVLTTAQQARVVQLPRVVIRVDRQAELQRLAEADAARRVVVTTASK